MTTSTDRFNGLIGSSAVKPAVVVATTANITLAGLQTIDGIILIANDRVLVKNQSNAINNGIWVASTGQWSRAKDFNGIYDAQEGTLVVVSRGNTYAGRFFALTTQNPTIGTSALNFDIRLDVQQPNFNFVTNWGATGNGATDDTTSIQQAENILNALYISTGSVQNLYFPSGNYSISASIQKKSGVVWSGCGKIRRIDNSSPVGACFSLVTADAITKWGVTGLEFENVPHDIRLSSGISRSSDFGKENSCFEIKSCTKFYITQCKFKKYSLGIKLHDNYDWLIVDNFFTAENNKTLESIKNGTFTNFSSYQGTGAIELANYGVQVSNATGNLTTGSNIITSVSDTTKYYVGQNIQPRVSNVNVAGFEIPATITSIGTGTLTLNKQSGANVTGASVTLPAKLNKKNENYIIARNVIDNVGLDTAIFALAQTFDQSRGIISENIITGGNSGIVAYRGTFFEPDIFTETYAGNLLVTNNIINWTTENGYYQRGVIGCQVTNNKTYRTGTRGALGNASSCAYVFRVSPFTPVLDVQEQFVSAALNIMPNDQSTLFANNVAIDHGTVSGSDDAVILIEHDNIICNNNIITRSEKFSTTKTGYAIYAGNGKQLNNVNICDNKITGHFEEAIRYVDVVKNSNFKDYAKIENNILTGKFNRFILVQAYTFNTSVKDNICNGDVVNEFVRIADSPYSEIINNKFNGNSEANVILLESGNLASDSAYFLSKGQISKNIRRGGTLIIDNNEMNGRYVTAFNLTETATGDVTFSGRCKSFKNNYLNGVLHVDARTGGTASTADAKTWQVHDFCPNSSIAVGQPIGKYCITSGTYGNTTYGTGNVTNGSNVISDVSSLDGYGMGIFLTPSSGFSSPTEIIAIKSIYEKSMGDLTNGSNVISNVDYFSGFYVGMTLEFSAGFSAPTLITAINIANKTITVADNSTVTLATVKFNVATNCIVTQANSSATATGITLTVPAPVFATPANLS